MGLLTLKTTRQRYVHDGPIRYGNDSACCVVWRSVGNVSLQMYGLCHGRRSFTD